MQKSPTARQRSSLLGRTRLQAAFEIGTTTESGALAIGRNAERFEVRGIEGGFVTDLRCIYGPKVADRVASKWLDHRVEVCGRVERCASGRARLMKVAHLKLVDAPDNAKQQIEFDFPDENS